MAYFAEIDSNNIVLRVISIHNNELLDNGIEKEQKGIDFCKYLYGQGTNWKQASYNTRWGQHVLNGTPFRKNFPSPGFTYDLIRDAFIWPKPYPSFTLNENTCDWDPPIPFPTQQVSPENPHPKIYKWNEEIQNWTVLNTTTNTYETLI